VTLPVNNAPALPAPRPISDQGLNGDSTVISALADRGAA
jgi:hypothetical protein